MKPVSLLIVMALIWALTNFWWIPLVSRSWKAGSVRQQVMRAGILAVIEKLRDLALVACITLILVLLLVSLANAFAASSSFSRSVLQATEAMYAVAKTWNERYALALTWITLIGVVLCLYLAGRTAKRRVTHVWAEKAAEVLEGFRHNTHLDEARADPRLKPLVDSLDNAIIQFQTLHHAKPPTSEHILESKRSEIGEWLNLLAMEIAAKDLDMEAALSARAPWEKEADATTKLTLWSKLRTLLVSDQLAKDLGLIRKPLSYVMTGLLVISLVGWSAEPMATSLRLAVNNLRVNVSENTTDRELAAVSKATSEPSEHEQGEDDTDDALDLDDLPSSQHVARMLAHAATHDFLRAHLLRSTMAEAATAADASASTAAAGTTRRAASASRADLVRAALLDATPISVDGADKLARSASRIQGEVAADLAGARPSASLAEATAAFRAHVEQAALPQVEALRREKAGDFAKLSRQLAGRYDTPISALQAQDKIMGEMIRQAFRNVELDVTGEAAIQAQRLIKEFGEKAFKSYAVSEAKRYVTREILAASRPEALHLLQTRAPINFAGSSYVDELAVQLAKVDGPDKQWASSAASVRESQMLKGIQETADDVLPHPSSADVSALEARRADLARVNALESFDDLFPSPMRAPPASSVGSLAQSAYSVASQFVRRPATSFRRARVSFAVRGVVIGHDAEGSDLNVTGLRWNLRKPQGGVTRVHLDLMVGDRWKEVGDFDAAVVNQALRYAADQRVIAATIVPGDSVLVGRMTSTHPALLDTPLGCRIIELDRFVDTASSVQPALAGLAADRDQMSRWRNRAEISERLARSKIDNPQCVEALSPWGRAQSTPVRFSPQLSQGFSKFTQGLDGQHGASVRWLMSVRACNELAGSALVACTCEQASKTSLTSRYWFPEDHTSQVREREAKLDPDLTWLARSPDRIGNLDFAVHTTFAVRSAGNGEPMDEDWADSYDFPPAEIALLRKTLGTWAPSYIAGFDRGGMPAARSYQDFMGPVEDFVLLQRLFRAALAGQLGDDFPLTLLPRLQGETRKFVPTQPTIRWELSDEIDEDLFIERLKIRNADAAATYGAWRQDRVRRYLTRAPTCDVVSR